MSGFDYLSLIKRQAKARAKTESVKLSAAQKSIATEGGFDHYHELQKVASKNPDDVRLMRIALQADDLKEVVYGEKLYEKIAYMVEGEMSPYMAETNADGFDIDQLTVNKVAYDQESGVLAIYADITYSGYQKPDQPYSGTTFYLNVAIRLFRLVDNWEVLDTEDALQILEVESDQDRDRQQQSVNSWESLSAMTGAVSPADLFNTGRLSDIASGTGAIAKAFEASSTGAIAKAFEDNGTGAIAKAFEASSTGAIAKAFEASSTGSIAKAFEASSTGAIAKAFEASSTIDRLRKRGLI